MFVALLVAAILFQQDIPVSGQSTPAQIAVQSIPSTTDIEQLRAKANAGDASAQLFLGRAYEDGKGVPQNDPQAASWYRKSADQGNASAQNSLGLMYREGRGVQRDQAEALKWYHKAARQKNATAMFNLGTAYYNGDGVGINDTLSCAWFLLAKEQGSPNAKEALSKDGKKLLSTDLVSAWFVIAMMYRKGEDLERNDAEAIKWLTKAADNGNPDAKVQIATMYANGQGVPKDFGRVLELCESAAKQNYGPGSYCVGVIHRQGLGIAKDSREALKWFRNAAEQNHSGAAMVLVDMYEKGEGTEVNRVEAYYWLFMAFTEGVTDTHERAAQLWRQMQPSDIKHLEKKLQGLNYDPKKVFKELGTEIPQA